MKKNIQKGMIDVGEKSASRRTAKAEATVLLSAEAFQELKAGGCPKGNVLETARIAGIMAVKRTPEVIPFCHPLEISKANVVCQLDAKNHTVHIVSEVAYTGKTGVEMEALTAVSAAALTVYDMMKYADKGIVLKEIRLLQKTGGKSGDFKRTP